MLALTLGHRIAFQCSISLGLGAGVRYGSEAQKGDSDCPLSRLLPQISGANCLCRSGEVARIISTVVASAPVHGDYTCYWWAWSGN